MNWIHKELGAYCPVNTSSESINFRRMGEIHMFGVRRDGAGTLLPVYPTFSRQKIQPYTCLTQDLPWVFHHIDDLFGHSVDRFLLG